MLRIIPIVEISVRETEMLNKLICNFELFTWQKYYYLLRNKSLLMTILLLVVIYTKLLKIAIKK